MKLIVKGRVIRGEGIGKTTGYPTANLNRRYFKSHPVPKGVYAAIATVGNNRYQSLVIIGIPFVRGRRDFKIEVHLLNFKGSLRNRLLEAEIVKKLRPIKVYREKKDLLLQIKNDVKQAKKLLE